MRTPLRSFRYEYSVSQKKGRVGVETAILKGLELLFRQGLIGQVIPKKVIVSKAYTSGTGYQHRYVHCSLDGNTSLSLVLITCDNYPSRGDKWSATAARIENKDSVVEVERSGGDDLNIFWKKWDRPQDILAYWHEIDHSV